MPGGDDTPGLTPKQQVERHMKKIEAGPTGLLAYNAGPGWALAGLAIAKIVPAASSPAGRAAMA
jgi:hypothetical protein